LRPLICDLMVTNNAAFETSQSKSCCNIERGRKVDKDGMVVQFGVEGDRDRAIDQVGEDSERLRALGARIEDFTAINVTYLIA
jgi:hypothetical protein